MNRVYASWSQLAPHWSSLRDKLGCLVFTNGCFDVLHRGHVQYLEEARALGHSLMVGLNSDASVRRLKGRARPIVPFEDRAAVLAGLRAVDLVVGFEEDTPLALIESVKPQVLVKGGDWSVDQIVGGDTVLSHGGRVISLAFREGHSTTNIVNAIAQRVREGLI
ncbi:MAG: D-glycero-beta-D-manno-heptose 1-phosphate adenylyltransferase [Acidobacteria bacterium]|nr:D-glycero-beta-D-manno-heptose 1-phosphate adenylyltransferase [Acidobacteriota bacterium]